MSGILASLLGGGVNPFTLNVTNLVKPNVSALATAQGDAMHQVAALRVTGSFQLDDTDAALALVAHALPVRIERRTRYWVTVVAV